jgi:signal transduction histidine kinase
VANALKYSPAGAVITIKVYETSTTHVISVQDDGPGVAEEYRVRLAERFFRVDEGRGQPREGYGLGLAITKAYMSILGGALTYQPALPHGSDFQLSLPRNLHTSDKS